MGSGLFWQVKARLNCGLGQQCYLEYKCHCCMCTAEALLDDGGLREGISVNSGLNPDLGPFPSNSIVLVWTDWVFTVPIT
jgi:hypothetical protein